MTLLSRQTYAASASNVPNFKTGEPSDQVHLEFIRDQAAIADPAGGEAVEAYHRSLFLYRNAGEMERLDQQARLHEHRLRGLELRLSEIEGQLSSLPHLLANPLGPQPGEPTERPPSTPWNAWDVAMFILAGVGVVGLLVFGIFNISFNLLESGLVTFQENPVRAYFWAALLPAGALAVKVGWDCLRHPKLRGVYLWSCLVLGILGLLFALFSVLRETDLPRYSLTVAPFAVVLAFRDVWSNRRRIRDRRRPHRRTHGQVHASHIRRPRARAGQCPA